jgi:hypothetical protein
MSYNETFTVRIDSGVLVAAREQAAKSGDSLSTIVRKALESYLYMPLVANQVESPTQIDSTVHNKAKAELDRLIAEARAKQKEKNNDA